MGRFAPRPLLVLIVAASLLSACAESQGGRAAFRTGDAIVVPASETIDGDLYAAGGAVSVNGTVRGDVYAAASTVTINGHVTGDVVVGAGQVTVSGPVDGDLRVGAGTLTVTGRVGEDVLAGAGTLDLAPGAQVGGDLHLGVGRASLGGDVRGDIRGQAGEYARTGAVGGRENVTITPRQEARALPPPAPRNPVADGLRDLAALLIVGALVALAAPSPLRAVVSRLRAAPVLSLGWGILAWVAVPFGLIVLTVAWSLVAAAFGIVSLGGLVALVVVTGLLADAAVVVALIAGGTLAVWIAAGGAAGQLLLGRLMPERQGSLLLAVVTGIVVLAALAAIPTVGALVTLVVVLSGAGALGAAALDAARTRFSTGKQAKTV